MDRGDLLFSYLRFTINGSEVIYYLTIYNLMDLGDLLFSYLRFTILLTLSNLQLKMSKSTTLNS